MILSTHLTQAPPARHFPWYAALRIGWVTAIGSCLLACAPTASNPRIVKIPVAFQSNATVSDQIFREVNSYRQSNARKPLQRHAGLDQLAQKHCEYMRQKRGSFSLRGKNVSHMGSESRALIARRRYQMDFVSENVASANRASGRPADALIRLWKGSKDHDKNMLDPWAYTGIGVVIDADGTAFATELFATVTSSRVMTLDRFNRF